MSEDGDDRHLQFVDHLVSREHRFMVDTDGNLTFVERCRRREEDERLFCQPGLMRGTTI